MDNKFSSSINDIDERIFEKYYAFERKLDIKRAQKAKMKAKLFAAAACFTIFACIGVTVILPAMRKDNPIDPLLPPNDTTTETEHSFLTDSVHQNGEKVEDDTNESAMETAEDTVAETLPLVNPTETEETDADTVEETVIETESIEEVTTSEEDTVVDTTEQKNLSDFMVDYGNFAVTMGDVEFFPIYGFVYSGPADGVGVDFYLEGIFGGEISDGDMPYLTLNDDINLSLSVNQTLYTYCINVATKKRNEINIDKLSSLPCGEYYIILRIATDMGQDSRCDEYIFKLAIKDNSLKI